MLALASLRRAVFALRVGPVPKLTVEAHPDGHRSRDDLRGPSRGGRAGPRDPAARARQGPVVEVLAERRHQPDGAPRPLQQRVTTDTLEARLGAEGLKGLRNGEATVRLVATRAGTVLRHPDPVSSSAR